MKKLLILLMTATGLFSCVEDEGNYTYTEVNQVTIEGLEESYSVLDKIDVIEIQPVIKGSILGDDLSQYEYQWHIHEGITEHIHTVISNEKDLNYKVDTGLGSFTLWLTVKDKTTGIKTMASTSLKVSTGISKGFLLLGDDLEEGIMGLDMVAMPAGRDTTVAENVYDNSETRFKGADRILYQGMRPGTAQSLWMCTDDGSFYMNNTEDISIVSELNDWGLIEISSDFGQKRPMKVIDVFPRQTTTNRSNMYRGYLTEDVAVFNMIITAEYFAQPCNRTSATATKLFNFYPLAFLQGVASGAYNYAFLYNEDEQCFMKINTNFNASHCTYLSDSATDPFPWNQKGTGRTMVWADNTANGSYGYSYSLMKDEDGKYYIYKFLVNNARGTKDKCYEVDMEVAEHLADAKLFMVANVNGYLLYAYGSTLYMYDFVYNSLIKKEMGAEITCLENEYSSAGSRTAFVVATYSDSEKGIVRKFDVGSDVNKLEIIDRPKEVWHTRLRVKDVEWKRAYGS